MRKASCRRREMTPTRLRGAEAESVHVLRYIPPVYPSAGSFKSLQTDFHLNESSFWLEGRNSADKLCWFGATGMILKEIKAQTVHRLTCHTPPVWAAGITQTAPHPPQSLVLLASGGAGIRVDVLLRGGGGCHTLWRGHQLSPPQPVDVPALPGLS